MLLRSPSGGTLNRRMMDVLLRGRKIQNKRKVKVQNVNKVADCLFKSPKYFLISNHHLPLIIFMIILIIIIMIILQSRTSQLFTVVDICLTSAT